MQHDAGGDPHGRNAHDLDSGDLDSGDLDSRDLDSGDLGELPEHATENRRYWNAMAHEWVAAGERAWAADDASWGIWGVPNSEVPILPDDLDGLDAIELGCGTGYVSAWMWRRGARVTGVDLSDAQLATARRLAAEHGADEIEWIHASAEAVPLPDASFDVAVSEYGAALWCDPYVWLPEAHRLLRPGGRLVFLSATPWATVCMSADGSVTSHSLVRSYFDIHRTDWRDVEIEPGGIEFSLPISSWFRLLVATGFVVEDYDEVRAPASATGTSYSTTAEWARHYPGEHVWWARKRPA